MKENDLVQIHEQIVKEAVKNRVQRRSFTERQVIEQMRIGVFMRSALQEADNEFKEAELQDTQRQQEEQVRLLQERTDALHKRNGG